jgi:membrane protein
MTQQDKAPMTIAQAMRRLRRLDPFLRHVLGRFQEDGCYGAAGALSYTTLLSLVPLLAIALTVLSVFPMFAHLRSQALMLIFDNFVPAVGSTLQVYIASFVASAGKTTAVGLLVLAFTAIMLLVTIEDRLNAIWRVHAPRRWVSRFVIYWTVMTLGPFLCGVGVSLSASLHGLTEHLALTGGLSRGLGFVLKDLGIVQLTVIEAFGLTLLYCLLPHCPVRWRDALIGAVTAAILFDILKALFSVYVLHIARYQAIYGALAVIPIFLFWMYCSWAVILFGAEVAASVPYWTMEQAGLIPVADDLELVLAALELLETRSRERGGPLGLSLLSRRLSVPPGVLADCLTRLERAEIVSKTALEGWVLSRDLAGVTLGALRQALGGDPALASAVTPLTGWRRRFADRLGPTRQAVDAALSTPVSVLIERRPDKAERAP